MAGNLAVAAKNELMDHLASLIDAVSVHTGDPGSTGANEATGGSPAYARLAPTFGSAASGVVTAGALNFDVAADTYTHLGLWASGTYWGKILLASPQVYTVQSVLPLLSFTLDENAVASA